MKGVLVPPAGMCFTYVLETGLGVRSDARVGDRIREGDLFRGLRKFWQEHLTKMLGKGSPRQDTALWINFDK